MKTLLLLVLIAFVPLIISHPHEGRELYNGQKKFYIRLLSALASKGSHDNRVISPFSIYHGLLMVYFGAEGETETTLKRVLHLEWAKDKNEVIRLYRRLNEWHDYHHDEIDFNSVDRLFVTHQAQLKPDMVKNFDKEIEKVNFVENRADVINHINQYIEKVTKGYVKNFYSEHTITPKTNLVLTNAVYYRGKWAHPFNKEWTKWENFYGHETNKVQMMKTNGRFNYGEVNELNACYIRLPYVGADEDLSMYVLLPKDETPYAVDDVIMKFTPETLDKILDGRWYHDVHVEIPKFETVKTKELKEVLTKMGVRNLFENSNLKGIADNIDLKFDNIVTHTHIVVDEESTTTSAGTGTVHVSSGQAEPQRFIVNRPFMYFIYDKSMDSILLTGAYRGPTHH